MNQRRRNPYQQELEQYGPTSPNDGQLFARRIIEEARRQGVTLEEDPRLLRETGDLDLEKQVPPQVYAVVSGVMAMIRKLEEQADESEPGHSGQGPQRRP